MTDDLHNASQAKLNVPAPRLFPERTPQQLQIADLIERCAAEKRRADEAERRVRELEAALPKTADGMTVLPDIEVWRYGWSAFDQKKSLAVVNAKAAKIDAHGGLETYGGERWCADYCYSKESLAVAAKEAAEAARAEGGGNV